MKNLRREKGAALTQAALNPILAAQERYATNRGGMRAILKGANLDGLSLANRNLTEAYFSGASLVEASLYGSNLTQASLYCTDLRGSDLRNARLTYADLRGASFKGARLSFAVLDYADLRSATMMYVGPDGVSILDHGNPSNDGNSATGVDFSNCSMKYTSFGHAKLDDVNFDGAVLSGAKFVDAKLTNASFHNAVLMGVNLKELQVPPESLAGCILDVSASAMAKSADLKARLDAHHKWASSEGRQGATAVLDGKDLRAVRKEFAGRSLIGLCARRAVAIGVDFSGCQLQGAKFDDADLRDADFTGADLSGTSLKGAKLAHAKFDKANLRNLHLLSGEIVPPDLTGANGTAEQFHGAELDVHISTLGLTG